MSGLGAALLTMPPAAAVVIVFRPMLRDLVLLIGLLVTLRRVDEHSRATVFTAFAEAVAARRQLRDRR